LVDIVSLFWIAGFAQADHMGFVAAHRKYCGIHDDSDEPQGDLTELAIVFPLINLGYSRGPIQAFGLIEPDAMLGAVRPVLGIVPCVTARGHAMQAT